MSGKLVVFSGPSGVGKGTIANELIRRGNYEFSVSMTTRLPRPGEIDGKSYYFVSQHEFDKTIEDGGFLEYVHKFGNSYGTPKAPIMKMLSEGKNVLLDIEMQGALNVKSMFSEAILIYILPPSIKELHKRLLGRGTETEEQIKIRTAEIKKEIELISKYDYYLISDITKTNADAVDDIVAGKGDRYKITDAKALISKYREG